MVEKALYGISTCTIVDGAKRNRLLYNHQVRFRTDTFLALATAVDILISSIQKDIYPAEYNYKINIINIGGDSL
ncbi:MAG: hypothetical protein A4E44_01031 [Methanosaeta sp. PtaB.Bin018]|jgi:hypothetical protein|nr:MAG: hypothetical protein A4E44_01031 [Methanosaeta sp. PtaB.Bin018]